MNEIKHVCFDVDDTLYPASKKFKEAKLPQHAKRLVQLLKDKNDRAIIALVEELLKQGNFNPKFNEMTTGGYQHLLDTYGEGGNANLYKKLGVNHAWVERDVYYISRKELVDWSHGSAIIDSLKMLRHENMGLSLFSNSSYGSIELNLRYSGFASEIQKELFEFNGPLFADENIGENKETLDKQLRENRITQADFDYMTEQYEAKKDFIERRVNVLSAEDKSEYKRPKLGGFERIKQCLNIAPAEILYVGDNPDKDIKPAKEAGFKTCHILWGSKVKDNKADYTINTLMEINKVIK